ncbi:hypothetical protein [Bradyrhizobium diazoefficiens]|uniref:hypothetical protein n=1 Tax=Bradyrhizobium diazoefficiens TaxID=1355477 RepID=UPI0027155226|nr:hypothetical protein [Bradyrhizobium diazoefficiens]WLC16295.1 hypothetical protein QIH76_40555 [Bradyrhizobium diazoefficiens]
MAENSVVPDEIEQQIIAILPSILQEPELWADNRSYLTRIMGRDKSGVDAAGYASINEEVWIKMFIQRLSALGRRLGFTSQDYDRQRGWGYDVLWRDLSTGGDWWVTNGVPLVLCCDFWVSGHSNYPSFEPLDKLLVARAEHRVLMCRHKYAGSVFDRYTSYIRQCGITKKKDRYLLLCYVPDDQKFHSHVFAA